MDDEEDEESFERESVCIGETVDPLDIVPVLIEEDVLEAVPEAEEVEVDDEVEVVITEEVFVAVGLEEEDDDELVDEDIEGDVVVEEVFDGVELAVALGVADEVGGENVNRSTSIGEIDRLNTLISLIDPE